MNSSRMNNRWKSVYQLDHQRRPINGSPEALAQAIGNAADLRIYTEFRHNEHIDPESNCAELVREVSEFGVTYLVDGHWSAGVMSLRQPVALPDSFGPRPSMSFFLYNQNGQQAIARPYLDGQPSLPEIEVAMPKYHLQQCSDEDTNAPSRNFIYDFETYNFCVADNWTEVFHHSAAGEVISGSIDRLAEEFAQGKEVKVGIEGICSRFGGLQHELFVQVGPCYYYTERKFFLAETHPVVLVKPAIPMVYASGNWDFGWLLPRTDGVVAQWLVDPYTLRFRKCESRHAIRWFVR